MSQLTSAITSLTHEHGTFISKGQQFLGRKAQARQQASDDRDAAQVAQAGAEGSETISDQQEAAALVAYESARDDQRAAHTAYRTNREALTQAKRARMHAEAVAAGDLDRYTRWLLDSPVAQGTLHLSFMSPRPTDGPSLSLDFVQRSYSAYENIPSYRVYE